MSTLQPPPLPRLPVERMAIPSTLPRRDLAHRHHRIRWTIISLAVVATVLLATGGWVAYRAISVINTKKLDGGRLSFFTQLKHIVTSGGDQLQGESEDRVNILLLGYGGPGHDGPYLTDTMMVASFKPSTDQLALISIPRDLVVNIPGYDYRKINNALSFGRDQKYPGGGEALAVKVVSDFLDLPIQYYARVDFDGFKDVIDRVGGVPITVDKAFSDYLYPDSSNGYAPISFKAGLQTMTGDQALKYSRSRHGNNGEGSDFARAKRQQKVIVALKNRLLSLGTLANPKKVSDILGSLGSHSQTNMEVWEMLRLAKLTGDVQSDQVINRVIDDSPTGLLHAAKGTNGAFILVPRDSTYHDVRFFAQYIFLIGAVDREGARLAVVNATSFTNLGASVARSLEEEGLTVVKISTLRTTTAGATILVSARPGQHRATEQLLQLYAHAAGTLTLADWQRQTGDSTLTQLLTAPLEGNSNRAANTNAASTTPDIILVLGQDQPKPSTVTSPFGPAPVSSSNTNSAGTNTNRAKSANTNSAAANKNTNSAVKNTNSTAPANSNSNTSAGIGTGSFQAQPVN